MFETKQAIRRAAREKALAKERDKGRREGFQAGRREGLQEGLQEGLREGWQHYNSRMAEARQRFGVLDEATGVVALPLTPEVENFLLGDAADSA